ncbi:inosine-5`-monophosphate dehydrogenase [Thermococcus litoralis DSM 5473]|uniref:Inosine-5`-monophosphate dehydrogenase n=2 Tax=Thermococcus litoralis TaxID=2265 RepID=H3ZJV5_THELN|nr:inosine-5`-monophosphate dehydrogenase [Thermococcus litoralis DSM 5473]
MTREEAFKRAERIKKENEVLYGVPFELEHKYLPLDVLIPTQWELSEKKLLVVLQEIAHGYDAPVIVLEHKGNYYILDGHHRAYARKKLGFSQIEAIILKPIKEIPTKIEESVKKVRLKSLDDIVIAKE